MMALTAWMGQMEHGWLVHALGWTLLHFCWQGAAVAGLLWCCLGLMGGRAASLRYGAACCALVLLVAAPVVTFGYLAGAVRAAAAAGQRPEVSWTVSVIAGRGAGSAWMERAAGGLDAAAPWLPWVWLAGVVLLLARLNVGLVVARRMKSMGTAAVPAELQRRFDGLRVRLGVTRVVRLMHSARVQAPAVIGWLRPVVLLPVSCLTGLTGEQIEALLAHELAHIRRHDYLVSVAQSVVEALLFYHPAVWWVSRQVRLERECRCDRMAVAVGGSALEYARALSFLETRRAGEPEFALGANGGVLTMRIKRLLGVRESSVVSQGAALCVLAAAIVAPATYLATAAHAQAGANAASAPLVAAASAKAHAEAVTAAVSAPVLAQARAVVPVQAVVEAAAQAPVVASAMTSAAPRNVQAMVAREAVAAAAGTGQSGPQRISAGVMAGQIASRVDPVYPRDAKEAHVQGSVVLRAIVGKDGGIENLQVVSGPEMLRASAIDAVRQWRYKPYLLNGEPTEVDTTITVNYTFGGDDTPRDPDGSISGAVLPQVAARVMAGQIVSRVDPVYPPEAKAAGVQGPVILRAVIGKDGTMQNLQILSGPPELRASALDAVRHWTYKPYLLNGQPTEVMTMVTVNYSLAGTVVGDEDVSRPRVVTTANPSYTDEARSKKISGSVLVSLVVNKDGNPTDVKVDRGLGYGLDEKAVEAVKRYKFKPAMRDGEPVASAIHIEVNFQVF